MYDIQRFYKMTQPMKHRSRKLLLRFIREYTAKICNRVTYFSIYNIYKLSNKYNLNLIFRHVYKDSGEVSCEPTGFCKGISGKCVKGVAKMYRHTRKYVDIDYFYLKHKGAEKILYTLSDIDITEHYYRTSLKQPQLIIDGKTFSPYGKIFNSVSYPKMPKRWESSTETKRENLYDVVQYDMTKLELHVETKGTDDNERHLFEEHCYRLMEQISSITLKDLEVHN